MHMERELCVWEGGGGGRTCEEAECPAGATDGSHCISTTQRLLAASHSLAHSSCGVAVMQTHLRLNTIERLRLSSNGEVDILLLSVLCCKFCIT